MKDMTPYRKLAADIGCGDSDIMPRIFAMIASEDEAKLMLAASPPATVEELAEKTGLARERVEEMIDPLFHRGLIFKSKKPDVTRYYKVRHLGQFHDATVLTPGISEEYLDLWREFETTEQVALRERLRGSEVPRGMRVVPVNVSIESQPQIAAPDDVTKIIEDARRIAVTNCSCRVIHRINDVPLEACIQINKAADYALERGTGRELTREEALDLLRICEEEGLVHCVDNRFEVKHAICNCDAEACTNWRPNPAFARTFVAPSRFAAEIADDACSGCDACVDRCFFNAISLAGSDERPLVDGDSCVGCGLCIISCPDDAITLQEVRPQASLPAYPG
jgi:ferredoxin/predicted transcriptional regulator